MRKLLITLALSLLLGGLPSAAMAHFPTGADEKQRTEFAMWECRALGNVAYQTGKKMLMGQSLVHQQAVIKDYANMSGYDAVTSYLMGKIAEIIYLSRAEDRIGEEGGQSLDELGLMVYTECAKAHGYGTVEPKAEKSDLLI